MYGKSRPTTNVPRFVQAPTFAGAAYQPFPTGPGQPPYRVNVNDLIRPLPQNLDRKMVFHICGDTGGVNDPNPQVRVVDAMESDYHHSAADVLPAFFYHLGDVVYFNGEEDEYYPQFYHPYEHYPAAITAIPGNHDGLPKPNGQIRSGIETFIENFCAAPAAHGPAPQAQDTPREAMHQPNPYWTLLTPLATFIGLYTNVPEGGEVKPDQQDWFINELKQADRNKAILVSLHHPVVSADKFHSGSPKMKELVDRAVQAAGVHPDIVFTAHVHNYQRFTRTDGEKHHTYIVAGAGGYHHLHPLADFNGAKVTPPFRDLKQPDFVLESYVDDTHGFMRAEIEGDLITCRYFAVPRAQDPPTLPARVADFFQVNWRTDRLMR
jgi:hypothetical protein